MLVFLSSYSLFRLKLPFGCIDFFEKEDQRLLSGFIFGFKASLFLLFELGNCSKISYVVIVLVAIVTPHVGFLGIVRILAYIITIKRNSFLLTY
jgi:hypothetical protein